MIFRSTRLGRFSIDSIDSIDQLWGLICMHSNSTTRHRHMQTYAYPQKVCKNPHPSTHMEMHRILQTLVQSTQVSTCAKYTSVHFIQDMFRFCGLPHAEPCGACAVQHQHSNMFLCVKLIRLHAYPCTFPFSTVPFREKTCGTKCSVDGA